MDTAPGDGKLVSASFGAPGGRLTLGPGLPSLLVPAGALDDDGRMFALRAVTPPGAGLPQGTARSPIFQLNPPTEARLEHAFVVSTPLAELDGGCPTGGLRLAVERPVDMGPGTPTLRWDYEPTTVMGRTASASLVRLYGQRLEFICLGGGSP